MFLRLPKRCRFDSAYVEVSPPSQIIAPAILPSNQKAGALMLHQIPRSPFQPQTHTPPSKPLPITPQNPLNQSSVEHNYRNICNLLLSITHSRSLFKGLQLHGHIVKSGFLTIHLVCHHLINFYSKSQLPHYSRQVFEETPVKIFHHLELCDLRICPK
ncbi:putative pentatricopeptide repeat-containing protein [Vitis vinifera]|uniref:Putative pentatricopeptide repeat-containing protein n=1 Tax=Vitis vinifera TaxID=29760 RepID=A0A438JLE9_VITVI|nr:putative pentatricopeptide repeat-containing protein [Vitis vinifera]